MKHSTYNYEGGQPFKVEAPFAPTGDQPTAIQSLTEGIERGEWAQVLLVLLVLVRPLQWPRLLRQFKSRP